MIPDGAKVFIIDDDPAFCASLVRFLRSVGFEAESFASARDFLAGATAEGPACALVDLKMPDVDGLELQDALERSPRKVPVVFITGAGEISDSVKAMRAGAVDFLTKPVDEHQLIDAVERGLLEDTRKREERRRQADARARLARLTPRETQVCHLVAQGLLNKQVAARLGLSEPTVKAHRQQVMFKLQVDSVAALVRLVDLASQGTGPVLPRQ
ncbi:MAG: response regulator transcription factor [Myxococcaceae bacterium]